MSVVSTPVWPLPTPYADRMHPDLASGWRCMVCGADRAFHDIAVAHRPVAAFPDRFPEIRINVRYCVDNPDCVAHAHAAGPWPAS